MHNLQELTNPGASDGMQARLAALEAEEARENPVDNTERVIIVCNSLPLKMKHDPEGSSSRGHSWQFEMDPDSIYGQSAAGILSGTSAERTLPRRSGVRGRAVQQEAVAADITERFNCVPVFLGAELKDKHYKGFCKQFLWPLMLHPSHLRRRRRGGTARPTGRDTSPQTRDSQIRWWRCSTRTAISCGFTTTTSCSSLRSSGRDTTRFGVGIFSTVRSRRLRSFERSRTETSCSVDFSTPTSSVFTPSTTLVTSSRAPLVCWV